MNRECSIAMNAFCKLNLWNSNIKVLGCHNGVYDLEVKERISDLDEIIVPDEYHVGAFYAENYACFEIFKEDKKLCVLYPIV